MEKIKIELTDWQKNQVSILETSKAQLREREQFLVASILDSKNIKPEIVKSFDIVNGEFIVTFKD